MSNKLFPSPVVQAWGIEWPIKKSPGFSTLIQTPSNRRGELRIGLMAYPTWTFELDLSYLKGDMSAAEVGSAFQEVIGFFGGQLGPASSWLYQDPYDNNCIGQNLGIGDGSTNTFQLYRTTNGMVDLMQVALPTAVYISSTPVAAGPQPSGNAWYCGIENLLEYSQSFSNAIWTKVGIGGAAAPVVTANTQVAPDGNTTASTIVFAATSTTAKASYLEQAIGVGYLGQQFTFSIWLKAAGAVSVIANLNDSAGNFAAQATFNVTTSWQRFQFTGTFPNVAINVPGAVVNIGLFGVVSSAVTVYAWGAQVERWPSATSYTATTSQAIAPNGIVSFVTAPAADAGVSSDFGFYYRCRFMDDRFTDLQETLYRIWELKSLKFTSILL